MSNYAKYYSINKNKTNPNKCLLKVPQLANASYSGWSKLSYPDSLLLYFTSTWYSDRTLAMSDFLYKYVDSIIKNESFNFNDFSCVGEDGKDHYIFREIKEEHGACTENIYSERIYTNFVSYVMNNHGQRVSILHTLVNHPEYLKSLIFRSNANMPYRVSYMNGGNDKKFTAFAELTIANETVSDDNKNKILNGFNHFIEYISAQSIYSEDELVLGHRRKSYISLLFSLYLEFFIYTEDQEHINQLFEVFHKIGNVKAKTFNKYLKNNAEITNFTERPIGRYIIFNTNVFCNPLDEYYYFISFYKKYDGGKFLNKIVSDSLIQSYIMAFKTITAQKIAVKKEYYTLFNEVKNNEVYDLEIFEQMNNLVAAQLKGTSALDILEQNFTLLELCLSIDVYGGQWNSDMYNLFTHIGYETLNEQQQARYWKMVANFVNNTKFKSTKIKKVLSDIVKLLNITTGELITKLQPHVISIKQPILLEMYLE